MESILTVVALLLIVALALLTSADARPGFHSFVDGVAPARGSRHRTTSVAWRNLPFIPRRRPAPGLPVAAGTTRALPDSAPSEAQPSFDGVQVIIVPDATATPVTPR